MRTLAVVLALVALGGCTGGGKWTKCRHLEAGDLQKHSSEGNWLRIVVEYRVLDGSPTKVEWRTTDTFLKQLPKSAVPAGTKEYAEGVVILKPGEQVRCDRM